MSTATVTEETVTPPGWRTVKSDDGLELIRDVRMVRVDSLKAGRQALPDLPTDEYEALKKDIAENGVLVPLEVDDHGNVLDGLHRFRACQELEVERVPVIVRHDRTEKQKLAHALRLNLRRRHLTREERDEVIRLALSGGKSYRQAAEEVGVSEATARRAAISTETSVAVNGSEAVPAPSENVTGKDERTRQRTSPKRKAAAKARRKPKAVEEPTVPSEQGAAKPTATAPPDEEASPEATSAAPAPEQPKTARGKSLAVEEIIEATKHASGVLARHEQAPPRRREDVLASVDGLIREARAFLKRSGAKATGGG